MTLQIKYNEIREEAYQQGFQSGEEHGHKALLNALYSLVSFGKIDSSAAAASSGLSLSDFLAELKAIHPLE